MEQGKNPTDSKEMDKVEMDYFFTALWGGERKRVLQNKIDYKDLQMRIHLIDENPLVNAGSSS